MALQVIHHDGGDLVHAIGCDAVYPLPMAGGRSFDEHEHAETARCPACLPAVVALDLFGEPAQPAPTATTGEQLDLLDGSRYVRRCGGCSQTVNRCRCAAVGITEAPELF